MKSKLGDFWDKGNTVMRYLGQEQNTQERRHDCKAVFKPPDSVNETYFEHMRFALWFAFWLGAAAFAALVHAVIPAAFEKTGSRIIAKLYERTHNRGR